jgi:hypothetical protein
VRVSVFYMCLKSVRSHAHTLSSLHSQVLLDGTNAAMTHTIINMHHEAPQRKGHATKPVFLKKLTNQIAIFSLVCRCVCVSACVNACLSVQVHACVYVSCINFHPYTPTYTYAHSVVCTCHIARAQALTSSHSWSSSVANSLPPFLGAAA